MKVKYVAADGGELIDNGPIQIRIVEDGSNTSHRVGLTEVHIAPSTQGPPQHLHRVHEEVFYVVSGLIRFTSAEEHIDVKRGGLITAPIGAPHTFANPDPDEPAVMLVTYTPDRYIRYFREMGALGVGPGGIKAEATLELMRGYDTEPYPPR
ncbi:cupin domain-containing protein [Streptomyces sp. NBC_00878]|uniref:cupin domain-containing protein n=1 Tax=Streptomyces sp. NBC_00878 TaxID=2975854 RepID=UPI00225998A2|nr:cupin domain-containing protein [Streptomyces sp. NBC_00878]MCX4909024.1 cupin domain-containing protein [Streptomyces sp. NBC_00878]